jgi:hypothetical protein
MKRHLLTLFFFLVSFSYITSQVTKTNKWRKTERDSFENAFLLYEDKLYKMALPIYEACNKNHPHEEFIMYMYGKTALYRPDKHADALTYLTEAYDKNKKIIQIELDLAKANHLNYKFDEALKFVNDFLAQKKLKPEEKEEAELTKKYIENAKKYHSAPTGAKITNLGDSINSTEEEYVPVISTDESMLVFTYSGEKSKGGRVNAFGEVSTIGVYMEDAYISFKKNDVFAGPKPLENINTGINDAAISLSPEGNTLYVFRDNGDDHGDIYQSSLIGEDFTAPIKIKGEVNTFAWDGHCTVSADGKVMYFSSERVGGYGGKDIWRATLKADSTWGNVVNLGDSVNSKYDEDAPFIHPDGLTLFYSSNGTKSSGGFDVFMTNMEADSTFKHVENIGYPINSPDDDIYFVVAANGTRGYYSSGKDGGKGLKDIYMVETNFPSNKLKVYLVKGKVTSEGKPIEAGFVVEITTLDNKVYRNAKSNTVNGNYLTTLPAGQKYKLKFSYKEFKDQEFEIDASQIEKYTEMLLDIKFDIPKDTTPIVKRDSLVKDTFVTTNKKLTNIKNFAGKYGDVTSEGLEFKVQVAAFKYPKNYTYKHLKGLGDISKTLDGNGKVTLITVGPAFKTLREAWDLNKKAVNAGQKDAFVTAYYKGKRIYLEQLEKLGIFKAEEAK